MIALSYRNSKLLRYTRISRNAIMCSFRKTQVLCCLLKIRGRFDKPSSAGAYLGLTPRRYEFGEVSRNEHIFRHGDGMTRKQFYEAATTLLTRTTSFSAWKAWGLRLAKVSGFKKARVAIARSGRHSPRYVENEHGVPLEQAGRMISKLWT